MIKRQQPHQTIMNYFDVSLLDEYAKKVEGLGSRLKVPKKRIPRTARLSLAQTPRRRRLF